MSQGSRRAQDDVRQDFEPSSKQASGKTGGRKAGTGGTADHSDILEDDLAELMTSMKGMSDEVTNRPNLDVPSSALAELAADGSLDESTAATLGTAASLGNVASDLSQQLASITEEMNKIREELYGDSGIGGIAKELASLKAGSLGGLLGEGSQDSFDILNDLGRNAGAERPTSRKSTSGNSAASTRASTRSEARSSSSANEEATRQRRPAASNDNTGSSRSASEKMEELRRKSESWKRNEKKPSVSIPDKLMLLFLVLVLLYIGSPFFRTAVKKAFSSWVGGREDEEEEEIFDY